jgi:hypothetical protein
MRMSKLSRIMPLGLVIALLLIPGGVNGNNDEPPPLPKTLRVCPQGPPSCHYSKIQEAIDAARPNGIILIEAGTYLENLTISKSLSLVATEPGTVRIQGKEPAIETITFDKAQGDFQVILEGLTILGGPPAREDEAHPLSPVCTEQNCPVGIDIRPEGSHSSLRLTLIDVQVGPTESHGLFCGSEQRFTGSAYVHLFHSRFVDNDHGAILWLCRHRETVFRVDQTVFSGNDFGLVISADATDIEIKGTKLIGNNGYGVIVTSKDALHLTITNSWFQNNDLGVGFAAPQAGKGLLNIRESYFINNFTGLNLGNILEEEPKDQVVAHIEDSIFLGNHQYGLLLVNDYRLMIQNNTIQENGTGIMVRRSSNLLDISDNVITHNKEWGVALYLPPCEDVDIPPPIVIEGEGNEIRDNGEGDLCPEDFNWPSNFRLP